MKRLYIQATLSTFLGVAYVIRISEYIKRYFPWRKFDLSRRTSSVRLYVTSLPAPSIVAASTKAEETKYNFAGQVSS